MNLNQPSANRRSSEHASASRRLLPALPSHRRGVASSGSALIFLQIMEGGKSVVRTIGAGGTPSFLGGVLPGISLRPPLQQHKCMHPDTGKYNKALDLADQEICDCLAKEIDRGLPEAENKIWHAHPVWFLDGNPVVGYSKLKNCVRLLFWSGQSFDEDGLKKEGSFKAAEARYTSVDEVNTKDLRRWLAKARDIQWDYKNIVRRKGHLERIK